MPLLTSQGDPFPATAARHGVRPYFPELDGVRAIAALIVMFFHFSQTFQVGGPVALGQTGVDLFFVLSGFLITTILLLSPQGSWREIRTFYIRRTLRIFPLYYGYLLLLAATGSGVSLWFWFYAQNIPISLGMPYRGPNHFWTLALEEQFYLIWPFLVIFLPRRWLKPVLWTMCVVALLIRYPLMRFGIGPFYFPLSRMDGLAAGALVAVLHRSGTLATRQRLIVSLGLLSGVALAVEGYLAGHRGLAWIQISRFTITTCFYACLVAHVVLGRSPQLNAALRWPPLRWVGRISYGLYVFHPAIFEFVKTKLPGTPKALALLVCFGAVFPVASLSWYGFERYFVKLKGRLAPEPSTTA